MVLLLILIFNPMNVVQSYLTSIMKGDFSLYETRLFVKIVERANKELEGRKVKELPRNVSLYTGSDLHMKIAIRDIVADGSHDYNKVFKAAQGLADKAIEYWSDKAGKWVSNQYRDAAGVTHYYQHLIERVSSKNGSGFIEFNVSLFLMNYILTFVNGAFSMYDLQVALSLPTAYSVRMYWLTASATQPVPYPVQMLRDLLGTGAKYPSNKDFIRRCIDAPAKVLESRGLNGYAYKVIHQYEQSKTSAIKTILIIPLKRQPLSGNQVVARLPLNSWCQPELRQYLQTQCQFTDQDLHSIKLTLADFQSLPDWRDRLVRIVHHARSKGAGKGYIINAMRDEHAKNVTVLGR